MTPKTRRISLLSIRIILGAVFLGSGIGKIFDSGYVNYDLVRLVATSYFWVIEYAAAIIISISLVELLLASLLLWGKAVQWAFAGSLIMLISFTAILGYFYVQGMNVASCGCFGALGIGGGLEFTLLRNTILIGLTITALLLERHISAPVLN